MSYYIEQNSWTMDNEIIWQQLCENEQTKELAFKQYFQRAWPRLEFDTPFEALEMVRKIKGLDAPVYLNEDHDSIYGVYPDLNEVCKLYKIVAVV